MAQALADWGLIAWPNRVDALMNGMLRRRPELLFACVATWCRLCLPFYLEPHYRDPTHVGDFIDIAADAAGAGLIAEFVPILQSAIEVDSRAHERLTLLKRLQAAASRHGYTDHQLERALSRWSSEALPPRRSYTPQKYDDAATLDELQRAFEADGAKLDYNAPHRFSELAESAPLEQVRQMYERWDSLQSDTRCRFMLVERLIQADEKAYARNLLDEYEASDDERGSWSQWMGGGKFRYFHARKLLDGVAVHRAAYENFVDSIAAGQENTLSLLAEIDSILPVICAAPDWPAIWALLAEQMAATREHQLGASFELSQAPLDDEELLADLLHFALRLPVAVVQQHARHGALQLANQSAGGQEVFELVIRRLLAGGLEEPLQALQLLLLLDHDYFAPSLGATLADLVNHRDVTVAEAAGLLARRWGIAVSVAPQPLPLLYQLELGSSVEVDDGLRDAATGAMRVEDSMSWTQWLRPVAQVLAEAAGSDEANIRHRAAMFIQEWGGLEAFGQPAIKRLEAQLRGLQMQITYFKPHALIAVLALRHVAGELRRAGLLARRDMPEILERLGAPLPPLPLMRARIRPQGISRPHVARDAHWRDGERLWAEQDDNDVASWSTGGGEHVVAEISRFKVVEARRAEYRLQRIRAPRLQVDSDEFWNWYKELPAAAWLGQVVPLDAEPAPTLVRRLVSSLGMDAPDYQIILCPNWLRRLRWQAHDQDPSIYVDTNAAVVARVEWWRDAGPVNIDDDAVWGEGIYVALTADGLRQFMSFRGDSWIHAFARREVKMHREDGAQILKTARYSYSS